MRVMRVTSISFLIFPLMSVFDTSYIIIATAFRMFSPRAPFFACGIFVFDFLAFGFEEWFWVYFIRFFFWALTEAF
jgi:hypothetical protein